MILTVAKEVKGGMGYDMSVDIENVEEACRLMKEFMREPAKEYPVKEHPAIINILNTMIAAADGPGNAGYRNGLRYAKSLFEHEPPEYEEEDSWIPLKDRRPELGKVVLFGCDVGNGCVTQGYLSAGGLYVNAGNGGMLPYDPTHWMPLPEPPK